MLRFTGRFLIRCRWPLIVAFATMVFLLFTLQPRPQAEYRLNSFSLGQTRFCDRFLISASGKYLALFDSTKDDFYLYRLDDLSLVFKHAYIGMTAWGFDAEDGLVFACYGSSKEIEDDTIVECWHWQPDQVLPQRLSSRQAYPQNTFSWHSNRFNGLRTFGKGHVINCLLSPDARTWLFPSRDETTFHFDLIDSATGQVRARLSRPDIRIKDTDVTDLEVAFSNDSQRLLSQAIPGNYGRPEQDGYVMECFDVKTGTQLFASKLHGNARIGRPFLIEQDRVMAVGKIKDQLHLQCLTKQGDYRQSLLPETVPSQAEVMLDKQSETTWSPRIEYPTFMVSVQRKVIYCWEHALFPNTRIFEGMPAYLPGYHYAVRDIASGSLIRTEELTDPQKNKEDMSRSGWNLLTIMPDQVLLLQQPYQRLAPWQEKVETWRRQYLSWLPEIFRTPTRLQLIDAMTGNRLGNLSIPYGNLRTFFHKEQSALYISCQTDEDFIIQKYAYPLRKPWLVILSWTLGVFTILASLQGLLHLFRRRRKQPLTTGRENRIVACL